MLSVTAHNCVPSHQHSGWPIVGAYFMLGNEREKGWERRKKVKKWRKLKWGEAVIKSTQF